MTTFCIDIYESYPDILFIELYNRHYTLIAISIIFPLSAFSDIEQF
jgi:hypothetical protein